MKLPEQIKKWPWKRIAIGVAMISSVAVSTSFGTYAYFTSGVENNSTFASGVLKIGLEGGAVTFAADDDQPFLPGVRFHDRLTVANEGDVAVKFAVLAGKASGDDIVYDQLMVEIRDGNDQLLYHGRVSDLSKSNVVIPELAKGGSETLYFTVYLPESAGNEVMQKTAEVEFSFLATQQENGEYFAQSAPVMTLTPDSFASGDAQQVINEAVEGTIFILAEGDYTIPAGFEISRNVTLQAEKGKEDKVVLHGEGDVILRMENASVDGLSFAGASSVGIEAGSHVSIVNSHFAGSLDAAVRSADEESGGLTVKSSRFANGGDGIVIDKEMKAVMILGNTFSDVRRGIVASNEKASEVQVLQNDFTGVSGNAVESGGVAIGDGLEGFREESPEEGGKPRLALHLQKLDIYLEDNRYDE
jgi:hypothetical protein